MQVHGTLEHRFHLHCHGTILNALISPALGPGGPQVGLRETPRDPSSGVPTNEQVTPPHTRADSTEKAAVCIIGCLPSKPEEGPSADPDRITDSDWLWRPTKYMAGLTTEYKQQKPYTTCHSSYKWASRINPSLPALLQLVPLSPSMFAIA